MLNENSNYKSFLLGTLIGGAVGAITALLLAPKSGRELRRDIVDTSTDIYDKAADYVTNSIQEGKSKAQNIINVARRQADSMIEVANEYLDDAKHKVSTSKETVQDRFENLKEAAKAGSEAFKAELNNNNK